MRSEAGVPDREISSFLMALVDSDTKLQYEHPKGVVMRTMKIMAVAIATLALLWLAGPAMAQQDPYPPGGGVEGEDEGRNGNVSGTTDADGGLPFTGAEITLYSAVGLGAIGAGVLILRRTRTRTDA